MPVYLIRAGVSGPVKIGFAEDVRSRLVKMQVDNHENLILIREFIGGREEEDHLHTMFFAKRLRGEWHEYDIRMIGDVGLTEAEVPSVTPFVPRILENGTMELADWMASEKLTLVAFGKMTGASHSSVSRWCSGKLFPRRAKLVLIRDLTDGKVMPSNFVTKCSERLAKAVS